MTEIFISADQLLPTVKVPLECPICKKKGSISLKKNRFPEEKRLLTLSINQGIICDHHFQAFIDRNFKVRGYQKVDLTISPSRENSTKVSLKRIYEDLWELIDDENEYFQEFIKKDPRRRDRADRMRDLLRC